MAMEPLEKTRIIQMLKEKDTQGTLSWMYTQDGPNPEDYLLGKRVDKHVEGETQKKQDDVAIFNERVAANIQLDMHAKMREDPLFAIKKKELEAKKELLSNPVKMKRLQRALDAQEKEKKKKDKKKRKKKKRGSDSDSDSDDLLSSYLTVMAKKMALADEAPSHQGPRRQHREKPEDDGDDERRNLPRKPRGDDRPFRNEGGGGRRRGSEDSDDDGGRRRWGREDNDGRQETRQYGLLGGHEQRRSKADCPPRRQHLSPEPLVPPKTKRKQRDSGSPPREEYRSMSPVEKHRSNHKSSRSPRPNKHRSRSPRLKQHRSRSPSEKGRSNNRSSGSPRPKKHRSRSPVARSSRSSSSPPRIKNKWHRQSRSRSRSPKKQRTPSSPKRKPTDEERQRRLEEMMDNARWRDNQRKTNVQRYEAEAKKEEKSLMQRGEAKFISSMMSEHAAKSSVEDRIKRNKYNIQRTNASLSKNFTKQ